LLILMSSLTLAARLFKTTPVAVLRSVVRSLRRVPPSVRRYWRLYQFKRKLRKLKTVEAVG
jgi:hypothetical protein